ncbi:ABC transporter ATP-binding protein [Acrocarpospora pleiomorpha]|uniref:ABC transporter ATP-binding protein n=1 Tax=Acrocarpospora pleiomorpha TaxID=90975 RepID=A0A5M3XX93_9ACTN|nr:ATP-binding cassette domain-containing protein [Acrocarpospora pleiomorpha]GES25774.1 ABC transporter ATP-binding protein [Acrocarpospora pleiomorpha]
MSDPVLRVTDLTKVYTARNLIGRQYVVHRAVDGLSVSVDAGETVAVVGESGAGKSTVGRLALRLIEPTSGTVELLGRDLASMRSSELRKMRAHATMIFQDPYTSLNPRLTIQSAIAEPLEVVGAADRRERARLVGDLIERVGLTQAHLSRYPYELSGGQLQRVAIARALITQPSFIVCDEPVAALDVSTQAQVINLLRDLQRERGIAYLFISHDLRLVRLLADRVAVMRGGALVEEGTTDAVYRQPTSSYTKSLLNSIPAGSPRARKFGLPPTTPRTTPHGPDVSMAVGGRSGS